MIRISHRGNYKGKDTFRENTSSYIEEAIIEGYDVEVDVWLLKGKWYLGHDMPREEIDVSFLERHQIWTHAKDLQGYVSLYNNPKVHVFWHRDDDFAITSKGIKWCRAGILTYDGIMVLPESDCEIFRKIHWQVIKPLGICSDNFTLYENCL